jgi:hypothetical protein
MDSKLAFGKKHVLTLYINIMPFLQDSGKNLVQEHLEQEKINKAHAIKAIREKEAHYKARDEARKKEDAADDAAYQEANKIRQGEKETWKTVPGKSWWKPGGRKSKKLSRKNKRKTLRKKRKSNK